jgi:hypothetical protein
MAAALTGAVGDPEWVHHDGMVARHAVEAALDALRGILVDLRSLR